jgi:hypothetical protein
MEACNTFSARGLSFLSSPLATFVPSSHKKRGYKKPRKVYNKGEPQDNEMD